LGIYDGTEEGVVLKWLGPPDRENIEGVAKTMFYEKLHAWFHLSKRKVYMLGIERNGPLDKAPPCKTGAETCQPWERDWSKIGLKPGAIVSTSGHIAQPAGDGK
jgi:hypothetical protein